MAVARLVASAYSVTGTVVVNQNETSLYTNTDNSSNPARITHTTSGTSSYYLYLKGFNFSAVPSNAVVSSFTVKVKGYETSLSTSTSYAPRLYNNSSGTTWSTITGASAASTNFGTSSKTITVPYTGDWDTLKGYGSNLGIRLVIRRSNRNTQGYLYIYGAEIEVTYTIPVYHSVTITNGTSATVTASESNPLEGTDVEIRSDTVSGITIKDNGTDVTSQFTQRQESGASYTVTNITTTYGFALNSNNYYESNNKAHASTAAVCRVDFYLPVTATITFSLINYAEATYDFGLLSNVDTTLNTNASADTSNVFWSGKNNNSANVQTVTYTGVTSGDHYIYVKFFKDQYTDENNDSLQFKVAITLTEPYTPSTYYGYDITNIQGDHAIVVTASSAQPELYVKVNGSWVQVQAAYKKVNGSWVQQSDLTTVFQQGVNYKQG